MKRIIVAVIFSLLLSRPVFAQSTTDWSITDYSSDITVHTDASIDVHEVIHVQFFGEHHGIFRLIPLTATFNGKKVHLPISNISAKEDSQDLPPAISVSGNNQRIEIRDSGPALTGKHVYDLFYHVTGAVNFFPTFDELNWNVTGNDWAVSIPKVEATLHLPQTSAIPTTLCYTGPKGSTAQNCSGSATAGQATFTATDNLTVISHWPKGLITQPSDYDHIRTAASTTEMLTWLVWGVSALIPLAVFFLMFRRWSESGKDPEEQKTIIAQYEPPTDVRPAEALMIARQSVDSRALSSTIIDLAVRGYLRIEEREKTGFMAHGKDYALIQLKQSDPALRDYEQMVLDLLFQPTLLDPQGAALLSKMKSHQKSIYLMVAAVNSAISAGVTARGYFSSDPSATRKKYATVGGVLLIGGYIALRLLGDVPALVIVPAGAIGLAGLIVVGFGALMPRRTEKGAQADWQLKGFKLYLGTAEKYRLQWQEKQNIFETFLPYAMVLGVAEKWSKTFADMNLPPPSWYSGSDAWSSVYAWHALSSFNSALSSATIPSGGGSSGGGSGGGGGGGGGGAL